MNWDKLRTVLAISRCGTQSKAAQAMGVDQSTIGRQLSSLEAELGCILFVRTYSGLSPTEAGRVVIARAIEVEANIQNLGEELSQSQSQQSGPVTVIGNHWMLAWLIKNHLPDFQFKALDIQLHFNASHQHWTLTKGDAELALWFEISPRDGEFTIPIGKVSYATYAAPGLDHESLPWVSFRDPNAQRAPWRWLSHEKQQKDIKISTTASDASLVHEIIGTGIGKALLPCMLGDNAPDLVKVKGDDVILERELYIHTSYDMLDEGRVKSVISWLRESLQAGLCE
jgi:DNA-binding transcriptional LysR family regulator